MNYDAFISYSHGADGKLAPAIQRGLQRMAKPWYKRRALDVFRDDTGLSVNHNLWASIAEALGSSEFFLLFLSPQAADSEWVNKEIATWLESKPADRILPILTDGDLVWDAGSGDFDHARSTAVPPALFGALDEEPRHLDLRWARTEEQLDLHNGRFREAIADLAAPLHGIPKEDLEGEDVRLHRRARRLARAAVAGLVLLTLAALAAGALAFQAADEARQERDRAEAALEAERIAQERADEEEQRAIAEAERAEEQATRAEAEAERAEEQALVAAEESRRAEEEAVRAQEEAVRASLAPMCDALRSVRTIEARRGYEQLDGHSINTDANRYAILDDLWGSAYDAGVDGLDLVAVDAMFHFSYAVDEFGNEDVTADPNELPPFDTDYTGPDGAENGFEYHEGPVFMTYADAVAQLDSGIGTMCSDAGIDADPV